MVLRRVLGRAVLGFFERPLDELEEPAFIGVPDVFYSVLRRLESACGFPSLPFEAVLRGSQGIVAW